MVDIAALIGDLSAETAELDRLLAPLDAAGWQTPTPAAGWDIAATITHLLRSDEAGLVALDGGDPMNTVEGVLTPSYSGEDLRGDWLAASSALAGRLGNLPAGVRIPWFGPAMSQVAFITARLMETWAHGQDVADALGVTREPTGRIRHVCEIGVRTRGWSFSVRGREVPTVDIRVELSAPDGSTWAWGPAGAAESVTGTAEDFALLVTQRRHRDDLGLLVVGGAATGWVAIAQAFAGEATDGRPPIGA